MKKVYLVYSHFCAEIDHFYGIFSSLNLAQLFISEEEKIHNKSLDVDIEELSFFY